jgi:hypothetical protein
MDAISKINVITKGAKDYLDFLVEDWKSVNTLTSPKTTPQRKRVTPN